MAAKNYYLILNIAPSASALEIKKAYRKLALLYHPDKHVDEPASRNHFSEIQEAYQVLSNPDKRQAYHYKYFSHTAKNSTGLQPDSPEQILKLCNKINSQVRKADPYRVDRDALLADFRQILSAHNLNILRTNSNNTINRQIIHLLLQSMAILPYRNLTGISAALLSLAHGEQPLIREIEKNLHQLKYMYLWNRYKIWLVLLTAVLLCMYIYYLSA